jgi:hypothetical protein
VCDLIFQAGEAKQKALQTDLDSKNAIVSSLQLQLDSIEEHPHLINIKVMNPDLETKHFVTDS